MEEPQPLQLVPETPQTMEDSYEISPRKGTVSCAECRRSKLKCNRVFPCDACVRRGCQRLCPTGTQAATKGNKILETKITHLKNQNRILNQRFRDSEATVAELRATIAHYQGQPVPSTSQVVSLGAVGTSMISAVETLQDAVEDLTSTIGTLSIGANGQTRYHGDSASSEYFGDLLPSLSEIGIKISDEGSDFSPELKQLISHFPIGMRKPPCQKDILLGYIPRREDAVTLAKLYYEKASWMYDPLIESDFNELLLDKIYSEDGSSISVENVVPHALAAFFMVLASGSYYLEKPSLKPPEKLKYWLNLARASYGLESVYNHSSIWTVQTLLFMVKFMMNVDAATFEDRWLLTGLCVRIAQAVGLQTDSEGWGLDPAEVQRRRRLFWELFTYESWMSFVNGRSPALSLNHIAVRFPNDIAPFFGADGKTEMGWHAWKFQYSAICLSAAVQHTFSTRSGGYQALLDLDNRIRNFPVPHHLQSPVKGEKSTYTWSSNPYHAMTQYCLLSEREANLLYIHRPYFVTCLKEQPNNPLEHRYNLSVQAVFQSSLRLIGGLKELFALYEELTKSIWFFWSGVFSACIALAALVIESPASSLSHSAHVLLQEAVNFFEANSEYCRPRQTAEQLRALAQRACAVYTSYKCGIMSPPGTQDEAHELAVLRGQKSLINNASPGTPPGRPSPSRESSSRRASITLPLSQSSPSRTVQRKRSSNDTRRNDSAANAASGSSRSKGKKKASSKSPVKNGAQPDEGIHAQSSAMSQIPPDSSSHSVNPANQPTLLSHATPSDSLPPVHFPNQTHAFGFDMPMSDRLPPSHSLPPPSQATPSPNQLAHSSNPPTMDHLSSLNHIPASQPPLSYPFYPGTLHQQYPPLGSQSHSPHFPMHDMYPPINHSLQPSPFSPLARDPNSSTPGYFSSGIRNYQFAPYPPPSPRFQPLPSAPLPQHMLSSQQQQVPLHHTSLQPHLPLHHGSLPLHPQPMHNNPPPSQLPQHHSETPTHPLPPHHPQVSSATSSSFSPNIDMYFQTPPELQPSQQSFPDMYNPERVGEDDPAFYSHIRSGAQAWNSFMNSFQVNMEVDKTQRPQQQHQSPTTHP